MAKIYMPRIELTKKIVLQRRAELIMMLHAEGWTDIEIGEILNGMDRTWVYRIRTSMTEGAKKQARKKGSA